MLTIGALILTLSVRFAAISIVDATAEEVPFVGINPVTVGTTESVAVKFVVSDELILFEVSLAMNFMLYIPIRLGTVNELLNLLTVILLLILFNVNLCIVPLG